MARKCTGKQIALSPRDLLIFRALARYRYLRSTYLYAFAGGASETRFKERLGDLFHEGFIDRPRKQWELANARYMPAVYEIGERARRILSEESNARKLQATFLAATAHRQFAHAVLICECLASIELAALRRTDLRFIAWPEILARAPEQARTSPTPFRITSVTGAVIPDGFFGLEYRTQDKFAYRFFALEADRGTMPLVRPAGRQSSLFGKFTVYQEAIAQQVQRTQLGIPNLLVLTVTTDPARLRTILEKKAGISPVFLFTAAKPQRLSRPVLELLFAPWARAGVQPLCIDESG